MKCVSRDIYYTEFRVLYNYINSYISIYISIYLKVDIWSMVVDYPRSGIKV